MSVSTRNKTFFVDLVSSEISWSNGAAIYHTPPRCVVDNSREDFLRRNACSSILGHGMRNRVSECSRTNVVSLRVGKGRWWNMHLNNSVPHCIQHQLRDGMKPQLFQDIASVRFCGRQCHI